MGICAACGASHVANRRPIVLGTYLGLACRHYPCSRLGIGVWLSAPAARVAVEVDGRHVSLTTSRSDRYRRYWQGFVQDPHAQRLAGRMNRPLRVTIAATRSDGTRKHAHASTPITPGWG